MGLHVRGLLENATLTPGSGVDLSQALSSGDLDGDGLVEVMTGGQDTDISGEASDEGAAMFVYNQLGGAYESGIIALIEPGARVGASVDISQDMNGDDVADIAISAPAVGSGTVYVLSGCW